MALKVAIVTEYYYPLVGRITESVHHTDAKLRALGHAVEIVTSRVPTNGLRADLYEEILRT